MLQESGDEGDLAWSIRGVPKELREKLRDESKRTGQTIGRIVTLLLSEHFSEEADADNSAQPTLPDDLETRITRIEECLVGLGVSPK